MSETLEVIVGADNLARRRAKAHGTIAGIVTDYGGETQAEWFGTTLEAP
jgi:hypothetical protein